MSKIMKKEALEELGLSEEHKRSLKEIFKVNPGNAFGQTPLHILAS